VAPLTSHKPIETSKVCYRLLLLLTISGQNNFPPKKYFTGYIDKYAGIHVIIKTT
jgi:hypothetical protein